MSSQEDIHFQEGTNSSRASYRKVQTKYLNPPLKKNESNLRTLKTKLIPLRLNDPKDIDWLYRFIDSYHSLPKFMNPSREDLKNSRYFHYFKALAVAPKSASKSIKEPVIGITCYEERTPYLAETQKTIIAPDFRGQGWGKVLSDAIEKEVKKAGYLKIRSCIYSNNLAMLQIKLSQGYIIEGYHPDHDGPGLHEYSLGKILKKLKKKT